MGLNHADLYRATGDFPRALELVSKSLDTYNAVRGRSHPLAANAMMARGTIYLQSGDLPSAKRDLREAWNVRRAIFGIDKTETLEALGLYSMTVAAQENYQEAIPLMVEFVDSSRRVLGKNDSRRIPALLNLGVSYFKTGKLEEAEGPLLELIAICVDAADTNPPQCQVAAPMLLSIYNGLAVQFPDEGWDEKARLHKASF
jgi:tetratricopeptide (TPR) repeat protein